MSTSNILSPGIYYYEGKRKCYLIPAVDHYKVYLHDNLCGIGQKLRFSFNTTSSFYREKAQPKKQQKPVQLALFQKGVQRLQPKV